MKEETQIIHLDFPVQPKWRDFSRSPHIQRLCWQYAQRWGDWQKVLEQAAAHKDNFLRIPLIGESADNPHWINDWLPALDGILLYHFIATLKPKTYIEVGSGNSTKFARRAIRDHNLSTRIVSVDPCPRSDINAICDEVHRVGLEDLDLDVFTKLTADDILFVDNSHRALPNSDVTVFFMEIIGMLPKGILYGIHDIFLPGDYPNEWALRFYNEQYLLAAYLFGGADGDQVVFPGGYVSMQPDLIRILDVLWCHPALPGLAPYGGSFWLRKGSPIG